MTFSLPDLPNSALGTFCVSVTDAVRLEYVEVWHYRRKKSKDFRVFKLKGASIINPKTA